MSDTEKPLDRENYYNRVAKATTVGLIAGLLLGAYSAFSIEIPETLQPWLSQVRAIAICVTGACGALAGVVWAHAGLLLESFERLGKPNKNQPAGAPSPAEPSIPGGSGGDGS